MKTPTLLELAAKKIRPNQLNSVPNSMKKNVLKHTVWANIARQAAASSHHNLKKKKEVSNAIMHVVNMARQFGENSRQANLARKNLSRALGPVYSKTLNVSLPSRNLLKRLPFIFNSDPNNNKRPLSVGNFLARYGNQSRFSTQTKHTIPINRMSELPYYVIGSFINHGLVNNNRPLVRLGKRLGLLGKRKRN